MPSTLHPNHHHHHHYNHHTPWPFWLKSSIIFRNIRRLVWCPGCHFPACGSGFGLISKRLWLSAMIHVCQCCGSVAAGLVVDESLNSSVSFWRFGSELLLVLADPAMSLRAATPVETRDAALVFPLLGGHARLWCDLFESFTFSGRCPFCGGFSVSSLLRCWVFCSSSPSCFGSVIRDGEFEQVHCLLLGFCDRELEER